MPSRPRRVGRHPPFRDPVGPGQVDQRADRAHPADTGRDLLRPERAEDAISRSSGTPVGWAGPGRDNGGGQVGSRGVKLREEEVMVPSPDGPIRTIVITPVGGRTWPGLLLYTDIFQLTE